MPEPERSRSDRFLVAFARAEAALEDLLGTASGNSFRWLVRQAAKRDPLVRSVEDDLMELSELRNAIVHDRGGGYVVAEPHEQTVERLEKIVELIVDPPRIDEVMSRPVKACRPEEPVAEAARRMVDGEFSRLPVYAEDGAFLGLLTANAIARWVATRLAGAVDSLHEEPVSAVLEYGEAGQRFEVVDRRRLVTDVLAMFVDAPREGRRVEAVLVTPTGDSTERPMGIVTVQDLPRLYALITP
jgi:CBS domain-containing protein